MALPESQDLNLRFLHFLTTSSISIGIEISLIHSKTSVSFALTCCIFGPLSIVPNPLQHPSQHCLKTSKLFSTHSNRNNNKRNSFKSQVLLIPTSNTLISSNSTIKMSKNQQQPIILKKSDSSRSQRQKPEPQQPKILTKSTNKENVSAPTQVTVQQPKKEPEVQSEVLPMKSKIRFMYPHFNIDQKTFDYLDNDNSDFLVVAAIGAKNVGKSTLMNMIADQEYVKIDQDGGYKAFDGKHETFPTKKEQVRLGLGWIRSSLWIAGSSSFWIIQKNSSGHLEYVPCGSF